MPLLVVVRTEHLYFTIETDYLLQLRFSPTVPTADLLLVWS